MEVLYVDTCVLCSCSLATVDGERRHSTKLRQACDGCSCHEPKAPTPNSGGA